MPPVCARAWLSVINAQNPSCGARAARGMLWLAALVFNGLVRLRGVLYDRGLFRQERITVPVVSIGNLTLGGSGKTPMARLLARALQRGGRRPVVLCRSYAGSRQQGWVSDGRALIMDVADAGDEPCMLAEQLPGVVVGVARDRAGFAHDAAGKGDIIILDDGFQHRRLARDCDIVLLDALIGESGRFW